MAAIAVLVALWLTRTVNPLRGDSAEYLYFDRSRPVGYPAFLALVRLTTGNVALAVPAQLILIGGSMFALGLSFYRLTGRRTMSLVFQFFLLAMPAMWAASAHLMTEGLSAALIALWCALLLRNINAPGLRGAAMLVAVAALATTVRPSLVALFFATAAAILVAWPEGCRWRALLMAAAGLPLAWGATPLAQALVHGSPRTTSPLARGILQHTLYCDPRVTPRDPDARFVEQNAAAVRAYIGTVPSSMREQFRRVYSTPLRFGLIIPVLGQRHHLNVRSDVDPYLFAIASERVRANPGCYASSVARQYVRMASFDTDPTSEQARKIRALMEVRPPVELPQYPVLPGDAQMTLKAASEVHNKPSGLNPTRQRLNFDQKVPFIAVLPVRLLYGAAALMGIFSLFALSVRRRWTPNLRPMMSATIAMGIALHGVLAITALVELSDDRYLDPIWPIVCAVDALALLQLTQAASLRAALAKLRRTQIPPSPEPA